MYAAMIESWWAAVLRGGAAVLFGLCILLAPGLTLDGLVTLFALYALVDGAVALLLAWRAHDLAARLFLLEGIVSMALALLALVWPDITAFTLLLLVGLRALASGAAELVGALRLRRTGHVEWLLLGVAGASALSGLTLVLLPAMAMLAVLWWIALYALCVGGLFVALGLRLRATTRETADDGGMMAAA
jgi:uncharacterized membrane protein HdeD (DUF308 family)